MQLNESINHNNLGGYQGGGGGGGDRSCYNCGQAGHISRDCPEPRQGGGGGGGGGGGDYGGGGKCQFVFAIEPIQFWILFV